VLWQCAWLPCRECAVRLLCHGCVLDRGSVRCVKARVLGCYAFSVLCQGKSAGLCVQCYVEVEPMVAPEPDGKRRQQDAAAQPGEGAALTVMCRSVFVLWCAMAVCWPVGYLLCLNTAVTVLEYDHCA
jgi:hypothetical protein